MIHSTFRDLGRKTIPFSLIVAFRRSIEVNLSSPRKGLRSVRKHWMLDGLTKGVESNIEGFKGV